MESDSVEYIEHVACTEQNNGEPLSPVQKVPLHLVTGVQFDLLLPLTLIYIFFSLNFSVRTLPTDLLWNLKPNHLPAHSPKTYLPLNNQPTHYINYPLNLTTSVWPEGNHLGRGNLVILSLLHHPLLTVLFPPLPHFRAQHCRLQVTFGRNYLAITHQKHLQLRNCHPMHCCQIQIAKQ